MTVTLGINAFHSDSSACLARIGLHRAVVLDGRRYVWQPDSNAIARKSMDICP